MMPVNENDFDLMQEEAIRQAREMFRRSSPVPQDSVREQSEDSFPFSENQPVHGRQESGEDPSLIKMKNTPLNFFNGIVRDKDTVILLALILLLFSDSGDRLLILALIYIMS